MSKYWKIHKKVCYDLQETAFVKENFLPQDGIRGGPIANLMAQIMEVDIGPQENMPKIPRYHDEYKKAFPKDVDFYNRLRLNWTQTKMLLNDSVVQDEIRRKENDELCFLKRWRSSAVSNELKKFLSTNPKPGDIFKNRLTETYQGYAGKEIYQSMRNSAVPSQNFELGETYVAVGFVDLFPLVVGSIVSDGKVLSDQKRVMTYIGYDKSVIVIARNMVLYQMMLDNLSTDSILQAWFSTGWSKKTLNDFHHSCNEVLKALDVKTSHGLKIEELIIHWMNTTLRMKSVELLWVQHIEERMLETLRNLRYEKDRIEYARYLSTGHIFGNEKSDYIYGNLTMFTLPDSFRNFKREEENFFAAIALDSLEYDTSLLKSVSKKVKTGLRNLMDNIQNESVTCRFEVIDFSLERKDTLKEIKGMNAKAIDWSNISDYISHDEFFKMARACDGPKTTHFLHFMNWSNYVFGTCLFDYPNMYKEYQHLSQKRQQDYQLATKSNRSFLRQDKYLEFYMNSTKSVLAEKYMKNFIDFAFKGRNVDITEPISEKFNPFERSSATFFISFAFQK